MRSRYLLVSACTLLAVSAMAQQPAADAGQGPAAGGTNGTAAAAAVPTLWKEQGQTSLDESFDWSARWERIRGQRRDALADTRVDVQFRSMYLDRNKYDDSESSAWAAGGSAGLKTGYFRDLLAIGGTGYTSQRLYGPDDKDGTLLLKPGQHGYTVLGELYGDILLMDSLHAYVGRKAYDTPYINRNDTRMTPNTFEAATVQGQAKLMEGDLGLNYGAGYFTKIKERNSDRFVSMSKDAGAEVDRGVATAGGTLQMGTFSLGAIDYYSEDIINIGYAEAKGTVPLFGDVSPRMAVQYSDQQSTGDDLLTGEDFSADQFGVKAELPVRQATFTAAYTVTGDGANMQNPWSGYPGYTSVQVEDFNRSGESAVLLRAAYAFRVIAGLSAYALWVNGTTPDEGFARDEYNANIQWSPPDGVMKGLTLRGRYAIVDEHGGTSDNLEDLRLICSYDFPW